MKSIIRKGSVKVAIKLFIPLVAAAVILALFLSRNNVIQAEEDSTSVKYYKSIQIEPGDSLWSIAETYIDGHYSTIPEYIEEIKKINNLSSDTIHAYEYLMVAYYAEP